MADYLLQIKLIRKIVAVKNTPKRGWLRYRGDIGPDDRVDGVLFECKGKATRPTVNGERGKSVLYTTHIQLVVKPDGQILLIGCPAAVRAIGAIEGRRKNSGPFVIHPANLKNVIKKLQQAL